MRSRCLGISRTVRSWLSIYLLLLLQLLEKLWFQTISVLVYWFCDRRESYASGGGLTPNGTEAGHRKEIVSETDSDTSGQTFYKSRSVLVDFLYYWKTFGSDEAGEPPPKRKPMLRPTLSLGRKTFSVEYTGMWTVWRSKNLSQNAWWSTNTDVTGYHVDSKDHLHK